jgi:hypothetical protein
MAEKIFCSCCGKQIVSYPVISTDSLVTNGPVISMGPSLGVCCKFCAIDLDEDGLFPEEHHI